MRIQPTTNKPQPTFCNKLYRLIKSTPYGRCIIGSNKGYDYSIHTAIDKNTGNIQHKLYYIMKGNRWVKSVLRFFSNNKVYKELRSQAE